MAEYDNGREEMREIVVKSRGAALGGWRRLGGNGRRRECLNGGWWGWFLGAPLSLILCPEGINLTQSSEEGDAYKLMAEDWLVSCLGCGARGGKLSGGRGKDADPSSADAKRCRYCRPSTYSPYEVGGRGGREGRRARGGQERGRKGEREKGKKTKEAGEEERGGEKIGRGRGKGGEGQKGGRKRQGWQGEKGRKRRRRE
ncbi:hypothetical protein Tco_0924846 [Tanacetum coccineum]|uniref:Uncharacterized protein n=1 Tax=Tanacetum coccineum TaxID=301880 RepID=A0ABQ5D7S7_9ASTR